MSSAARELPTLPRLLPIEIPSQQPRESTTSVALPPDSSSTTPHPATSTIPSPSLRKSISVDSFVQYGRETARSSQGLLDSPQDPSRFSVAGTPSDAQSRPEKPAKLTRNRGDSIASVPVERDSISHLDPDVDRCDPLNVSTMERFRRASLKTQEPPKSFVRGGDLPLPSRAQSTIFMPGTSAVAASSHSREGIASIPSTSSLQGHSKQPSPHFPLNSGRTRSGSLGVNVSTSKRMSPYTNPSHRPTGSSSGANQDIVLVVIGTTGCGKSDLIERGLSGYGLTKSTVYSEPPHTSGLPRYIRRKTVITLTELETKKSSSSQLIEVIEVEVQTTNSGLLRWPQGLPQMDGLIICYDSSQKDSFLPVERLLKGYRSMVLPIMVLGCKADLEHQVDPIDASVVLKAYDTGLIEVSTKKGGGDRMLKSFGYLLGAVLRQRGPNRIIDHRNPASPDILDKAYWGQWTDTPTASPSTPSANFTAPFLIDTNVSPIPDDSNPSQEAATSPLSLDGAEVIADISPDAERPKLDGSEAVQPQQSDSESMEHLPSIPVGPQSPIDDKRVSHQELRSSQWADLEELLDKLLFLAVSGDDPTFTTHFLLTYRRFSTPRSVLLAMQKRMRQLDNPCGDPMFACFAQMRICHLLETWIRDFPHDFAVKGTAGALNALIKSIISKTHLLHYGSEFLPFLEQLPGLVDQDSAWAIKVDISDNDSEEYTPEDEDGDQKKMEEEDPVNTSNSRSKSTSKAPISRERKASLPLSKVSPPQLNGTHPQEPSPRQHIKDLQKLAQDVMNTDADDIAREITRAGVRLFMAIKPRDWLHYTFIPAKRCDSDPITTFNTMSNHLADWVVSLILCHERPRQRARQIEKFVEIAQKLRQMNNYSGLRAFVAGINNATDDPTMDQFKTRSPDSAKNLQSWDVLLQQMRAHRAYRLALRNSKGACIPALEVHISDLIRAHEGNGESKSSNPSKIHWGKFNMMGRFITITLQCQAQCRNSTDYEYPERPAVAELFVKRPVMSIEMQKSRLKSDDFVFDDVHPPTLGKSHQEGMTGLRKMFFW